LNPRRNFVSRAIIVVLLLIVVASVVIVRKSSLPVVAVQEDMLEPGDILFVDLYKGWSYPGYWDHMALYVGEQPYAGVVESTYDTGVYFTPLPDFLERDRPAGISVMRLRDMSGREEVIQRAIDYALAQVGKPFDFTATATIPLKINEKNLHCVEVVWRAYLAAGVNLDSDDGIFLYPDDIYYSHWLRPI
jgi:uncharacterized protein YycO